MTNSSNIVQGQLQQELRQVEDNKADVYEKRTQHKDAEGNTLFINRLILEDSPYLLQHAHNPVNWYAWGEEAFSTARREDKPVFLSIGYSTCHWCHVMEAESFDNVEVAKVLNQFFICIKLDREQYPDIDEIYMTSVQIMSGQGGWPMSNFLLADGKPFYSATYFPPQQFLSLLTRIASIWQKQRADLVESSSKVFKAIEQVLQGRKEILSVDMERIETSADEMLNREDKPLGGLAGAPKFPQEPLLFYFLEGAIRKRDLDKSEFSFRALDAMGRGGIYDQVAGGFHRYSTDARWLVPHFEKMLYNQSQLTGVYLLAWRLTGNWFFRRIIRQTLDYVLREMQSPDGGFFSATDADSEDVEGLYFIWTIKELKQHLTEQELDLCVRMYDLTEAGNFEGANILALSRSLDGFAEGRPLEEFEADLDKLLLKLRKVRERRIPPLRDDKLIIAWSADMVTSLVWAGQALEEEKYLEAAEKAVGIMWDRNFASQDSLQRICLNGVVSIPAQLEDYSNFCQALIALFDVTGKSGYLNKAAELMDQAVELFWNEVSGGLFLSQELAQGPRLARSSSASDSATLSAYGVAIDCLVSLAKRRALIETYNQDNDFYYDEKIQQCVNSLGASLNEHPASHNTLIRAINHHRLGSINLIQFAGDGQLRVEARRRDISSATANRQHPLVVLSLTLQPGFHISAGPDNKSERVPLKVSLSDDENHWEIESINMPQPTEVDGNSQLSVFEESLELKIQMKRIEREPDLLSNSIGLILQVQLCNENLCLPAEILKFRV